MDAARSPAVVPDPTYELRSRPEIGVFRLLVSLVQIAILSLWAWLSWQSIETSRRAAVLGISPTRPYNPPSLEAEIIWLVCMVIAPMLLAMFELSLILWTVAGIEIVKIQGR